MARFASIDIGSNTFRLLIAEVDKSATLKKIHSENRITRIGEGYGDKKVICPAAIARAVSALISFRDRIEKEAAKKEIDALIVIGTSAVREAKNRKRFLETVKQQCGFEIKVLSGEKEARCILLGVSLLYKDRSEPSLVIDIGGGSSEFIGTNGVDPPFFLSTSLGVVALTERHLQSDPPSLNEIKALTASIDSKLAKIGQNFPRDCRFVGCGGTATSLAAIDQRMLRYDSDKINHHRLSYSTVERILRDLTEKPLRALRKIPGIEPGREDLIVAGGLILKSVMKRFGYSCIYISDYGLREGALIDLYQKQSADYQRV